MSNDPSPVPDPGDSAPTRPTNALAAFVRRFRSPEARARQARFERERRAEAIRLMREETECRQADGFAADLPQGQALIRTRVAKLAGAVRWSLETKKAIGSYGEVTGTAAKGGRPCSYHGLLKQVDPEVTALLVLREMLKSAFAPDSSQTDLARNVAVSLEQEAMVQAFKREQPEIFDESVKCVRKRKGGDLRAQEELMVRMRTACAQQWLPWPASTAQLMALDLLYLASADSEFFVRDQAEVVRAGRLMRTVRYRLSDSGRKWWAEEGLRLEGLIQDRQPMVCVPIPWSGPWGGGHVSTDTPPIPLVRNKGRKYLGDLQGLDLGVVYKALNAVQGTPWMIDPDVLMVARELWRRRSLPFAPSKELPPQGPPPSGDSPEWKPWWARRYRELERERRRASQLERIRHVLDLAESYRDEAAIFFPHNLDFRGRMYPCSSVLHPQGADLERGLLRFAVGKALRGQEDADWLALHGANRYGRTDLSFWERVLWVREHEPKILAAAAEPLEPESLAFWSKAQHPFQFLGFCFEWRRYRSCSDGAYVSTIPIALDGSCNGLQHLYALTLDERGGRLVNLVPAKEPADIYITVAERTKELLDSVAQDAAEPEARRAQAAAWLEYGIDRGMAKPIVMVVPYGGTKAGCARTIRQFLRKREEEDGRLYPCAGEGGKEALRMLTSVIWKALGDVIGSARDTMKWLQANALALARQKKPIWWTSPVGLPVLQEYRKTRCETIVYGPRQRKTRLQSVLRTRTASYDPRHQASGISPNYTHSLDAAHLMLTVSKALSHGVAQFAMIHDSYATTAADSIELAMCLREAFAEIYRGRPLDRLQEELRIQLGRRTRVKIPEKPAYGTLDPEDVYGSVFFFD